MELIIINCLDYYVVIFLGILLWGVLILLYKKNRLIIVVIMILKIVINRLMLIWQELSTRESLLMPCLWTLFIFNIYRRFLMKFFKEKISLCPLLYWPNGCGRKKRICLKFMKNLCFRPWFKPCLIW